MGEKQIVSAEHVNDLYDTIERLTAELEQLLAHNELLEAVYEASLAFRDHCELINYRPLTYQAFKDALNAIQTTDSESGQNFYVEEAKGFFWVTERSTKHNYAQTDSKERADEICKQLNLGVNEFDENGVPAEPSQPLDENERLTADAMFEQLFAPVSDSQGTDTPHSITGDDNSQCPHTDKQWPDCGCAEKG